ncbi:hypothetical protein CC2G_011212 [Coprinopsis cinerea AmutBmut pab1-1]|nr:hypothetical protein CC2G_011212 [Coprinopsis cinerea AmutBmut pab1-1]
MTALSKDVYDGCPFRNGGPRQGVHCGRIIALHVVVWAVVVLQILAFFYDRRGRTSSTPPSDDAKKSINKGSRGVDLEMGKVPASTPGQSGSATDQREKATQ